MTSVSHFKDIIKKYFKKVSKAYYEKVNGSKEEPKYLHEQMLTEDYSVDMTYDSISGNYSRVTADVVSFDSPLPLKSRGAIQNATGDIPKIGLKFVLNEKQMNNLRILKSMPGMIKQLATKLFADVESCIFGIKETIEEAFLLGLSSGYTLIKDETNVGHGIRIDYNIPRSNQFGSSIKWSSEEARPIDDLRRVLKGAKAKGEIPTHIWMNSDTVELMCQNKQIREQHAFNMNFVGNSIPVLDEEHLAVVIKKKLKLELRVVDRTFVHQKDGKNTTTQGWTPNMIVMTKGIKVGSLVYSTLAEEAFPQQGVSYAKPNKYILISKSGTTDPVSEKTAGQALVIPVLQNVDSFFYINTEEAQEVTSGEVEGDTKITIWDKELVKTSVVNAVKELGVTVKSNIKDETLIKKINELSDEQEAELRKKLGA